MNKTIQISFKSSIKAQLKENCNKYNISPNALISGVLKTIIKHPKKYTDLVDILTSDAKK